MKLRSMIAWISISMLSSHSSFAQISSHTSWADSLFQHLDKSQITTGVLYDRVYGLAELQDYNPSVDTINMYRFKQAYFELYDAAYDKTSWLKTCWTVKPILVTQSQCPGN